MMRTSLCGEGWRCPFLERGYPMFRMQCRWMEAGSRSKSFRAVCHDGMCDMRSDWDGNIEVLDLSLEKTETCKEQQMRTQL